MTLIAVISVGAAVWFVVSGLKAQSGGMKSLAGQLLEVTPREGAPLDFELTTMSGKTVKLSELAGKTVFLNFWATWCPPCIEEMPSLRRLHRKLATNPDFVFLAVSTDQDWPAVRRFFEREPAEFTVLLDAQGELARRYGTTKFPETYVIEDGRIAGHIIGPRDWDHWYAEAWLRAVLEDGAS